MSNPSRAELLDTIALLQGALNGVTIELTQGFNTMPRKQALREAVDECLTAEFYGRGVLERAGYWRKEAA